MARFNFRIGTKLGLTAGIGVVLVAGMLANQLLGNQSIAILSGWVVINRANAQAADSAILRAQLAALEISAAPSADQFGKSLQAERTGVRVNELLKAAGRIGDVVKLITAIAEQTNLSALNATVEEQGAATAEIARNVSEAAKGTAEVAEKITQVNRGASATGSASAQVLASARSLSKESGSLKSEVENFLNTVRAA